MTKRYLALITLGTWTDEQGEKKVHFMEAIIKPFEGKRPKGRCYEAKVYMVVDKVLAEHNKPTTFFTDCASWQILTDRIKSDWVEV